MKRQEVEIFYFSKNQVKLQNFIIEIIHGLTYLRYNHSNNFEESLVVRVEFLGPIQKKPLELDITNLTELAEILQEDKAMSEWLVNSAVAVNDTMVSSLDFTLKDGDKVSLLPPVCGG